MASRLSNWLESGQTKGNAQLESFFAERVPLDDEAFFNRFFSAGGVDREIAVGVRAEFLKWLPFDMRRLAPDDSFKNELNFVWSYDSLADVELICAIEKRFGVKISNVEGREAASLGDIIRLVQAKRTSINA